MASVVHAGSVPAGAGRGIGVIPTEPGAPRENRRRGVRTRRRPCWSGAPASARRSPPRCRRCARAPGASSRSRASRGSASRACSPTWRRARPRPAAPCSAARASEFEADLPYALLTEALDADWCRRRGWARTRARGDRRARRIASRLRDRHRTHRPARPARAAAAARSCWPGRRALGRSGVGRRARGAGAPAAGGAGAARAGGARGPGCPRRWRRRSPAPARGPRDRAARSAPLTEAEAAELVGDGAPRAIYPQAGGNPFYLEQLARVPLGRRAVGAPPRTASVPPAVAAALAAELAALAPEARRLLDAAAVAGDPFEPGLAADGRRAARAGGAAGARRAARRARWCARPRAPRRFAFRHPVVRHAVYVAAARRLAARRARARRRGARAPRRRPGGARPPRRARRARPATRTRSRCSPRPRRELQAPGARDRGALPRRRAAPAARRRSASERRAAAAPARRRPGRRGRRRGGARDAARRAAAAPAGERLALTVALANQEWWLGGHEDARRRLHVALAELPARAVAGSRSGCGSRSA